MVLVSCLRGWVKSLAVLASGPAFCIALLDVNSTTSPFEALPRHHELASMLTSRYDHKSDDASTPKDVGTANDRAVRRSPRRRSLSTHKTILNKAWGVFYRNSDEWAKYRLGDVVSGYIAGPRGRTQLLRKYEQLFPSSIATEYLHRSKQWSDYQLLCRIIQERAARALSEQRIADDRSELQAVTPSPDTLVVHFRLGDTAGASGEKLWANGGSRGGKMYVKPRRYYELALREVPKLVKKVVLIGSAKHGLHTTARQAANSARYMALAQLWFEGQGYEVVPRTDKPPDDDFVFMASSKHFLYGGGGFSHVVGECVEILGGQVYGSYFTNQTFPRT